MLIAYLSCHSKVGVRAGGPRRAEQSEGGKPPRSKQPKESLGLSVSLWIENEFEPDWFGKASDVFVNTPFEKKNTGQQNHNAR